MDFFFILLNLAKKQQTTADKQPATVIRQHTRPHKQTWQTTEIPAVQQQTKR